MGTATRWDGGGSGDARADFPRDDWEAPTVVFQGYNRLYGFTVDAAANSANALCARYFDREQDGLAQPWAGERVWCHPPHSDPAPWVRKARLESRRRDRPATVVLLVPAQTDADWWHDDVMPHASVRFLRRAHARFRLQRLPAPERGRLAGPRMPFAVVIFQPRASHGT